MQDGNDGTVYSYKTLQSEDRVASILLQHSVRTSFLYPTLWTSLRPKCLTSSTAVVVGQFKWLYRFIPRKHSLILLLSPVSLEGYTTYLFSGYMSEGVTLFSSH